MNSALNTVPVADREVVASYHANFLGLESVFEFRLMDGWVGVRWSIEKLGEAFPGGYWLAQNPVLHFIGEDGTAIELPLASGESSRATISGQKAFRRMRGEPMPDYPLTYAAALSQGGFSVRFFCELYDCRRLVQYCDAMQLFAGDFADMVRLFEEGATYWAKKANAEAAEPFHFACDLELGELDVPTDYLDTPYYQLNNESDLPVVSWESPYPLAEVLGRGGALQPENYFEAPVKSGISFMRETNFCRYGTHCLETTVPPGIVGTGMRPFAMWGNSFSLHYILTGDDESGAAGHYCANMVNAYIERRPNPHQHHILPTGIATMTLLRYARASARPDLLDQCLDLWRRWPYDYDRHNLATEPAADGGDTTANDTYNMKLVGACAIWLLGKYRGDEGLMERARDSVLKFIMPGLRPEGFWYYRPGSPEGALVNGLQTHNHYDGFVKMLLSRLLMHPEWRAEPGVMQGFRRGMDFSLRHLTADDGRTLKWELHPGVTYGPHETLARYLGHAGMFCEPLYVLAKHCDPSYLQPLQRSLQTVYDLRHNELLADYWDNSWLYSIYGGLFTLSSLGVEFERTPDSLQLSLGGQGTILL